MHVHTTFAQSSLFNRLLWWCYFGRWTRIHVVAVHCPRIKLTRAPLWFGAASVHCSRPRWINCCWSIRVNLLVSAQLLVAHLGVQWHDSCRLLGLHGDFVGNGSWGWNLLWFLEVAASWLLSLHRYFLIGGLHVGQSLTLVHGGRVLVSWVIRKLSLIMEQNIRWESLDNPLVLQALFRREPLLWVPL